MTSALREEIAKRDNYTCQICGKYMPDGVGLHIDHIVPIKKGGKAYRQIYKFYVQSVTVKNQAIKNFRTCSFWIVIVISEKCRIKLLIRHF